MLSTQEFEKRCEEINDRLRLCVGWQWNFLGGGPATKLMALREYMQKTITIIDKILIDDKL